MKPTLMSLVLGFALVVAFAPTASASDQTGGEAETPHARVTDDPESDDRSFGALPDGPVFVEEITVLGDAPFLYPVPMGEPVAIRFGIGEIEIEAAEISAVRADLDVTCGERLSDTLCEKYRRRLRLEPHQTDEGIEVRLVGLSKWKLRKLRMHGRVKVPRWSPLAVQIGIGEVEIRSGTRDLSVRMGIGDLTVRAPEAQVATVAVGTRIGDASVSASEGYLEGRRRALIGARAQWLEGHGTAHIEVGLRIGDAKVVLE